MHQVVRWLVAFAVAAAGAGVWASAALSQAPDAREFRFLVSGDARNCGDVVMPAIAEVARKQAVAFYWHLGDLRLGTDVDEDLRHQPQYQVRPMSVSAYLNGAWPDFIESQIKPFGSIPFMLGIGNHELVAPKTREDYLLQFADWLNTPLIRDQRLADDPTDHRLKTYYHWIQRGVDFITLDNASNDQFSTAQLLWFNRVVQRAVANPAVTTIVVGMHKALPSGYNTHSMDESPTSIETGRQVYATLLKARDQGRKRVYVLASHQHNYMETAYDTPYWREHGGVLDGWVVGTAGASRVPVVDPAPPRAITSLYGALLGTLRPEGEIEFEFQRVNEWDTPDAVMAKYGRPFVHWCYTENKSLRLQ